LKLLPAHGIRRSQPAPLDQGPWAHLVAFAGSDRGGEWAAAMYSLTVTAKLNDVDARAWLADVLARIADHPASRVHELLPWNWWKTQADSTAAAWPSAPRGPGRMNTDHRQLPVHRRRTHPGSSSV
jgi:hypothetical protein